MERRPAVRRYATSRRRALVCLEASFGDRAMMCSFVRGHRMLGTRRSVCSPTRHLRHTCDKPCLRTAAPGRKHKTCGASSVRRSWAAGPGTPDTIGLRTSSPSGRWKFRPTDPAELIAEGAPQRDRRDLPQVRVRSVEPVLTRWAEDVHVDRLLERLGLVWHAGGRCGAPRRRGRRSPRTGPHRARSATSPRGCR